MSNLVGLIAIGLILWSSLTIFSILGYISEEFLPLSIDSVIPINISSSTTLLLGLLLFAIGGGLIYKTYVK